MWEAGRLPFERLQQRMHHRGAGAAVELPAHLVTCDLLRVHGVDLTGRPFSERYAALRPCSSRRVWRRRLSLCPTNTDPKQAAVWLADYAAGGIEGRIGAGTKAAGSEPGDVQTFQHREQPRGVAPLARGDQERQRPAAALVGQMNLARQTAP